MERIFVRLRAESGKLQGVFSPEQTAMMKRVFVKVCHDADIQEESQERLALVILRATKTNTTETKLLALAQKTAKTF